MEYVTKANPLLTDEISGLIDTACHEQTAHESGAFQDSLKAVGDRNQVPAQALG
ncbi:MAG: hypothetical protein R3C56_16810 [Pirellulaceae bacterium]